MTAKCSRQFSQTKAGGSLNVTKQQNLPALFQALASDHTSVPRIYAHIGEPCQKRFLASSSQFCLPPVFFAEVGWGVHLPVLKIRVSEKLDKILGEGNSTNSLGFMARPGTLLVP